jgi:hypothetical protein
LHRTLIAISSQWSDWCGGVRYGRPIPAGIKVVVA